MVNLLEGAKRIRIVGKTAIGAGIFVNVFGFLATFLLHHTDLALWMPGQGSLPPFLVAGGLVVAVLGILLRIAGYVLEGFALPPRTDQPATTGHINAAP